MDLNYTAEDKAFRQQVRHWLEENIPKKRPETLDERRAWHRKLYEAGYLGMGWPKEYGGQEARPMEQAIVGEEMARANAPASLNGLGIGIVAPTLIHHGTEHQKQRARLQKILTAEELWCQLYSEPNSGSDLASLQCRADVDGDEFVINGQKIWTSGAINADWGILLARTDRSAPKHQGISCIMLDMHQPGVEVRPLKQISGSERVLRGLLHQCARQCGQPDRRDERGLADRPDDALATSAAATSSPASSRLQEMYAPHDRGLQDARSATASPAIEDPIVRQKLGEIYAEIEVLRYSALRLLSRLEKGQRPGPEASISKLHYSELDKHVQELFLDILGPYGQQTDGHAAGIRAARRFATSARRAVGPTPSSGRAPGRSTPVRRKSRRTSSASACSACRRKCARTASPSPKKRPQATEP